MISGVSVYVARRRPTPRKTSPGAAALTLRTSSGSVGSAALVTTPSPPSSQCACTVSATCATCAAATAVGSTLVNSA